MTTTPDFMDELKELCDEAATEAMDNAKKLTKKELVDQIGTMASLIAVSYTHLTLPTILRV